MSKHKEFPRNNVSYNFKLFSFNIYSCFCLFHYSLKIATTLCCPPETITTLWTGYTPIQNKVSFFKKSGKNRTKKKKVATLEFPGGPVVKTHEHVFIYVCVCSCMCVCMYICMYVYICSFPGGSDSRLCFEEIFISFNAGLSRD